MATAPEPLAKRIDYVQRVRALAPLFAAARDHQESARELDPRLLAGMHAAGLFRMLLPTWLDGAALDPLAYTEVVEEIAYHDASAAWCVNQGSGCAMVSGNLTQPVARKIFGQPDNVLAWGPSPGARARAVDGGYVVNYSGSYASGSRHAHWLGAHVLIDEADGTPRLTARGKPEIRTLLYPKGQAEVLDVWHVVGLRGTGSDSFVLRDLFVPAEHTLLRDDEATRLDPSPHYRYSSTMIYSSGFAHVALGIARAFIEEFIALGGKTPREARNALKDNPVVHAEVAQSRAKWMAARLFLRAAIAEAWEGALTLGRPSDAQRVQVRLAATFAIHSAKEIVDMLYDAAGATSIQENAPFERRFRDIHAVTQQLQGRKAHFESTGRFLMGQPIDINAAQM